MSQTNVKRRKEFLLRISILTSITLAAGSALAQTCGNNGLPERPVYIIAGQSNAAGLASVDDNTDDTSGATPDYFNDGTTFPNVQIYGIYGAPPGVLNMDDRSTANSVAWSNFADWGTVRPGYGFKHMAAYRSQVPYGTLTDEAVSRKLFGPELGIALFLNSEPQQQFIVKLAIAGSYLENVPGNANWAPGGHLYKELLKMVSAAYTKKASQFNLKVKGVFFMQGAADSESWTYANAYQVNLNNFITSLRNDLYSGQCATTTDIPFVIGRVQDNYMWGARMNTRIAQQNIDKISGSVAIVNTDDFIPKKNPDGSFASPNGMRIDGHFNEYGQAHLGARFYHALKVPFPPSDFIFKIQRPDGTSIDQPFYTNGGQYCCHDRSGISNIQNYIPWANQYVNTCAGHTCSVAPGY